MIIPAFEDLPLMGILRGIKLEQIDDLVGTVIDAGLKTLEITMNTSNAPVIIDRAVKAAKGSLSIGAGTVLSLPDLQSALDAGATFIVMPCIIKEIIDICREKNIPVFPGAFTPGEVFSAWNLNAYMIKIFPSSMFGPKYIKELKGPYDMVRLMAVGGVRPDNIKEYFHAGAEAVAFGGSVFKKQWMDNGEYAKIHKLVAEYVREVNSAIGKI